MCACHDGQWQRSHCHVVTCLGSERTRNCLCVTGAPHRGGRSVVLRFVFHNLELFLLYIGYATLGLRRSLLETKLIRRLLIGDKLVRVDYEGWSDYRLCTRR